ncbi:hypothetical protein OH491_10495 [Termitidicoccus mucosus]|uniref:Uncharacterized protein n=1 Tax=Termitidicoccus mucosus TaxID=1184151 RepID=A0A178IEQ9_9BACT|nr:hypothetical protein AW736_16860 [Opitutaceae bacterium TSB47]
MTNEDLFGKPVYSYTRKQAIADGVLIDLSGDKLIHAHWKYPLATTSTVWETVQSAVRDHDNDLNGILHDLSVLAKLRIRSGKTADSDTARFTAIIGKRTRALKLHLGLGDNHEPVLTLMFDDED